MIFHLFRKFPDKRFIVIADYHKDVLRSYLDAFADVKYMILDAEGTGTCSGIKRALEVIPDGETFMLVWSDLILPEEFEVPDGVQASELVEGATSVASTVAATGNNYIGISESFPCRWKYENGRLDEEESVENGVAGLFVFENKSVISDVPISGEFVRYLQGKEMRFCKIGLSGTREFGLISEYKKLENPKCRPFNRITTGGDIVIKEPVDKQGEDLAIRERAWYAAVADKGIEGIPKIYDTNPLKMERIQGRNIYECSFDIEERKRILESLVKTLKDLHGSEQSKSDAFSIKKAYFDKTFERLSKIQDLVPYAREKYITVNGRKCRNVYYYKREVERRIDKMGCDHFSLIHGDCTFSNMMVRDNGEPVLIDPRGYFGYTEIFGDERYDWAKLYYSLVGNYDRFNLKKFSLDIGGHSIYTDETSDEDKGLNAGEIRLEIQSNGWEDLEKEFFDLTGTDEDEIKFLHALIWLSLTTYAWQDFDSVCGAFYNGLYYLEEVL